MVHVRQGRPADHLHLRAIQETTLTEYSPELLDTAVHGPLGLLVAEDGEPVGYSLFLEADDVSTLLELAVRPERQGEGIGSTLLEETCLYLDKAGHSAVRLTARESDDRARQFYERHGFEREDYLPEYFDSGDAVLLSRRL